MDAILRLSIDWQICGDEMINRGWRANPLFKSTRQPNAIGTNVLVSDKQNPADQISEATDFLRVNSDYLQRLIRGQSIKAVLDFGVSRDDSSPQMAISNRTFPSELIAILVELGIKLNVSVYW
jgi:hypothetical protein